MLPPKLDISRDFFSLGAKKSQEKYILKFTYILRIGAALPN